MFCLLPSCFTSSASLLCLLSQLENINSLFDSYTNLLIWITDIQIWLLNKIQFIKINQIGTREQVESEIYCLNSIINKISIIYNKNPKFLNDSMPYIMRKMQMSKCLTDLKKIFQVLNHLLL